MTFGLGCGKSDDDSKEQEPAKEARLENKPPQAIWKPDPALAGELTQQGNLGKWRIMLPKEFTLMPPGPNVPPDVKSYFWKGQSTADVPPPMFVVMVFSDKETVEEGKRSMRQSLVNVSAGITDSVGIVIGSRERTETGSLDGIEFTRFKWFGTTKNHIGVTGLVYGAIDDSTAIVIITMNCGTDARKGSTLMETIIATFKMQ